MAIALDNAALQYFYQTQSTVTNEPMTLVGWAYTDEAIDQTIVAVSRDGSGYPYFNIGFENAGAGQKIRMRKRNQAGVASTLKSVSAYSLSTWYHIAGVFTSDNSRDLYVNGVLVDTSTTATTDSSVPNIFEVGVRKSSSPNEHLSGGFCELGVYDVALTADEIEALAKYYSPEHIRPDKLRGYFRGIGRRATELDDFTGSTWSNSGGFTRADHLPIRYASRGESQRSMSVVSPITPEPATVTFSAVGPTVVIGGATITPEPATVTFSAIGPTVTGYTRPGITWPFLMKRVGLTQSGVATMSVSTYSGNAALDLIVKNTAWTPGANRYLALFTSSTGLSTNSLGTSNEVNTGAYARLQIEGATGRTFNAAASLAMANQQDWAFASATGSWGTITHVAIVDSGTILAGNVLLWGALITPRPISSGDTFRFLTGDLDALITNV